MQRKIVDSIFESRKDISEIEGILKGSLVGKTIHLRCESIDPATGKGIMFYNPVKNYAGHLIEQMVDEYLKHLFEGYTEKLHEPNGKGKHSDFWIPYNGKVYNIDAKSQISVAARKELPNQTVYQGKHYITHMYNKLCGYNTACGKGISGKPNEEGKKSFDEYINCYNLCIEYTLNDCFDTKDGELLIINAYIYPVCMFFSFRADGSFVRHENSDHIKMCSLKKELVDAYRNGDKKVFEEQFDRIYKAVDMLQEEWVRKVK